MQDILPKETLRRLNDAWLEVYTKEKPKYNPLDILCAEDPTAFQKQLTWLLLQPEYFHFLAKHIFNVELAPFQSLILQVMWSKKFPMLIGARGLSKTFLLSLYALMRIFLIPERKIVIAGAAFRQSKLLFDYMETIWNKAPVLRDLCSKTNDGSSRANDMWQMKIGGGTASCIPIGDGGKIRGLRGDAICDEFSCLSYNTMVETNLGQIKIGDIVEKNIDCLVMNMYGNWEKPSRYIKTPLTRVYEIRTNYGISFRCSNIHQVMTSRGWKLGKDLNKNDQIILFFSDNINNFTFYTSIEYVTLLPDKENLYDFEMPETHSFIANNIIHHNSHNREIFETVISGFGMVKQNPVQSVQETFANKKAKELGVYVDEKKMLNVTNQIILSGTAYYDFNHFADYWRKWKKIILSKGDPKKLAEVFGSDGPPEGFDWKDYAVIRIPYELLPEGFMDAGNLARTKASVHRGIFEMEMCAVFSRDSAGFFKRSLIESCTGSDSNPVKVPSGDVYFDAVLEGDPSKSYVMGIDTASERDNFCITLLELNGDHRRIVYCWTITRKLHIERVKNEAVDENSYYTYCARKIRELMSKFNVVHIAMDSQGGGYAVSEALHDKNALRINEVPIWPIIEEKEKPSDHEAGLHILELCNFAKHDWLCEANHGLKKDMEDKVLLFPRFDSISLAYSSEADEFYERDYDTLEDCMVEIEEMKNELSIIEISQTATGKDRWDVPEIKTGVGKKERMKKDRYSALLMANMAARTPREPVMIASTFGGFASRSKPTDAVSFSGPAWFTEKANGLY